MSWPKVALGEVAAIDRNGVAPEDIPTGSLFVGLEHIQAGGRILKVPSVETGEISSTKFRFGPDHILYGKLRPYLAKIATPDFEGICSTDILPILPGPKLDKSFLAHFLRQPSIVQLATSRSSGANLPRLSPKALAEFEIPLPPLEEQKRIAAILDKADDLQRLRRRAIDRLDTLAQSIFYDMFGDPISNTKRWEFRPIGELFGLKHGFAFKSENFLDSGKYVLVTPGNFYEEGGFCDRGSKQKYHNDPVSAEYVLAEGDILLAMTEQAPGLLGSPIIVPQSGRYLHNQRLGKVEKKVGIESAFIFELMNSPTVRARIQKDATGLKVKHTSPTKIESISVSVPPIELQKRFSDSFDNIARQKVALKGSFSDYDCLFASLQQRAFRGEL